MADQQRWFKLWHAALSDDELQALTPALRWAWAALGCHTKIHGTHGRVVITRANAVLAMQMGVSLESLVVVISQLPHITVEEGTPANGKVTVTWKNWLKYQEDSTIAQRVSALRSKKRREEKRREENKKREETTPPLPPSVEGFERFWTEYPKKVGKGAARAAWMHAKADPLSEVILTAVVSQRAYLEREGGKFVPLPATWLNQRRWEDDPPTDFVHGKTKANLEGVATWLRQQQEARP